MATAANTNSPQQCGFRYLDLPAELQLRIIHFAVTRTHTINSAQSDETVIQQQLAQPAITRVSRSIRADGLPDYYRSSAFTWRTCLFESPDTLCNWLKAIGAAERRCMQGLVVELDVSCCGPQGDEFEFEEIRLWVDGMQAKVVKTGAFVYEVTFA